MIYDPLPLANATGDSFQPQPQRTPTDMTTTASESTIWRSPLQYPNYSILPSKAKSPVNARRCP